MHCSRTFRPPQAARFTQSLARLVRGGRSLGAVDHVVLFFCGEEMMDLWIVPHVSLEMLSLLIHCGFKVQKWLNLQVSS